MPGGDDQYDLELANEAEAEAEAEAESFERFHNKVYEATYHWLQGKPPNFRAAFTTFCNQFRKGNGMT